MRIAIAQFNPHIGNFEGNLEKMRLAIAEAKAANATILCFGELAVCGYPPRDFLEFDDFIRLCDHSIAQLAKESTADFAIVVGSPTRNPKPEGKDLYNSAYFLANGVVQQDRKSVV